jgi:hypothetical protein
MIDVFGTVGGKEVTGDQYSRIKSTLVLFCPPGQDLI